MENQINKIIDNLAEKLGVSASEIYSIVEYQVKVELVKTTVICVLCLAVLGLCLLYVQKVFFKKNMLERTLISELEDCDIAIFIHAILAVGVSIIAIIMVCLILMGFETIIQCLMNPQYFAMEKLFKLISVT